MPQKFVLRTITAMILASLTFFGSDCEDVINQINNNPCSGSNQINGNWTLIYNAGTTNDICPGENLVLPSSTGGVATLTCPNRPSVNRNYTVSNGTLTYTETNIQYSVSFTQDCQMVFTGINNNRILYYTATSNITDKKKIENPLNSVNLNSSEIKK